MHAGHYIDLQIHSFHTLLISWTTVFPKQLLPGDLVMSIADVISVDDCRREHGEHILGSLHVCFVIVLCMSVFKNRMSLSLNSQLLAWRGGGFSISGDIRGQAG